jgi:hypothetical protein
MLTPLVCVEEISLQSELCAPGHKSSKKRITVLCCTIVNSSLKIELFVISRAENPHSLKELKAKIFLMCKFGRQYGAYSLIHQGLRVSQTLSQQK